MVDDFVTMLRLLVQRHPGFVDSELTWDAAPTKRNERLFLSIDDQPDRMGYSVGVDTRFFSLADTEALLHGMQPLLVSTAVDV